MDILLAVNLLPTGLVLPAIKNPIIVHALLWHSLVRRPDQRWSNTHLSVAPLFISIILEIRIDGPAGA